MIIITCCQKTAMLSYCFAFLLTFLIASFPLQAQEKGNFQAEITTDIVSQNVWRGVYQAGTSIQPSLSLGYRNFELYVWGTTDFQSAQREIDFTISYTLWRFTLGITDYWCGDEISTYSRGHQFEGNVKYAFVRIPLSLEWNTFFWGEEKPYSFSSYTEINYALKLPVMDFDFSIGFTPWKNQMLKTERFSITNLSVTASKQIPISSLFFISPACSLLYNPTTNQLYFVAKVRFVFSKP